MDEAEQVLKRSIELRGRTAAPESPVFLVFVQASRGRRNQIDPALFQYRPEGIVDGDFAEWVGAVYALLGEKQPALTWLRRAVQLGNHNYPWFSARQELGQATCRPRIPASHARSRRLLETLQRPLRPLAVLNHAGMMNLQFSRALQIRRRHVLNLDDSLKSL